MKINGQNYGQEYLSGIENEVFSRMDAAGNKDGKITTDEALKDLDVKGLMKGQNLIDAVKIAVAASDIEDTLVQYAGEDGEFSSEEWADFLNGDEWDKVLNAWHSSGKKAQLEMNWTDNAHIKDGAMTKGELKVGILNNLSNKGINIDTTQIEAIVDKYAGEDGTFTLKEYQSLKKDPTYKALVEKFGVTPWYDGKNK